MNADPMDDYPDDDVHLDDDGVPVTDLRSRLRPLREAWDHAAERPGTLEHIIYRGKTHTLSGPPEAGKTILALWLAYKAMQNGASVLYWDEEIGQAPAAGLFQSLGAEPELVDKCLSYMPFAGLEWTPRDRRGLHELVGDLKPKLAIFDSSAAMMGAAGVNENDNGQVTRFWQQVWQPLAVNHNCAVIVIDHDARDGAESRYSRGGTSKLAVVDVQYKLIPVVPFSRAQDGWLQLTCKKDRPGWLHRNWQVRVSRNLDIRLIKTRMGDLSPAARRVLECMSTEQWMSQPEIIEATGDKSQDGRALRRETVSRALTRLTAMRLVDQLQDGGHPRWQLSGLTLDDLQAEYREAPPAPKESGWPEGTVGAEANGG